MSTGWREEVDVGKGMKGKAQPKDLAPTEEEAAAVKGGRTEPWPGVKRLSVKWTNRKWLSVRRTSV